MDVVPTEVSQNVERDLKKELSEAKDPGKLVLRVADERAIRPKFGVRRYSMPMLNSSLFPRDLVKTIVSEKPDLSEDDIKEAREASAALMIEAAVQIIEAKPIGSQVIEDPNSIDQMRKMVNRGGGMMIQLEASEPETVVRIARGALERRNAQNSKSWDERKVLDWTKGVFTKADNRLGEINNAISRYSRR